MGVAGKLITSRVEISNALISFECAYEWRVSYEPDFDKHQMLPVQIKWIEKEDDCTGGLNARLDYADTETYGGRVSVGVHFDWLI